MEINNPRKSIKSRIIAIAIPTILLLAYITLPYCVEFVPHQTIASYFPLSKKLKIHFERVQLTKLHIRENALAIMWQRVLLTTANASLPDNWFSHLSKKQKENLTNIIV